tara:strand:+ start:1300 stop:1692 length:393 start_codon:yes stop_codon:yes gene_type:complete
MAIYDDVKITINLNELVEIRAKLLTQYENYASKINKGEYLDENDVDRIASELRDTLTWDTLYQMVDEAVLKYLDLNENHYGETAGNEPAMSFEAEQKRQAKAKKEFEKNFDIVKLESSSWTIDVPMRKRK